MNVGTTETHSSRPIRGLVEAYPEQVVGREQQRGSYFQTWPASLFEELGFQQDRKIAKWRWVMRLRVEP